MVSWLSSWQEGCWADPGWQLGLPQTKVKADPADFYNNIDNSAFRLSALYVIDETSDLNVSSRGTTTMVPVGPTFIHVNL